MAYKYGQSAGNDSSSDSDDLTESCISTNRHKSSLLSKWKKSGLALRRYLYCLERKNSESSSVEEEENTRLLIENESCDTNEENGTICIQSKAKSLEDSLVSQSFVRKVAPSSLNCSQIFVQKRVKSFPVCKARECQTHKICTMTKSPRCSKGSRSFSEFGRSCLHSYTCTGKNTTPVISHDTIYSHHACQHQDLKCPIDKYNTSETMETSKDTITKNNQSKHGKMLNSNQKCGYLQDKCKVKNYNLPSLNTKHQSQIDNHKHNHDCDSSEILRIIGRDNTVWPLDECRTYSNVISVKQNDNCDKCSLEESNDPLQIVNCNSNSHGLNSVREGRVCNVYDKNISVANDICCSTFPSEKSEDKSTFDNCEENRTCFCIPNINRLCWHTVMPPGGDEHYQGKLCSYCDLSDCCTFHYGHVTNSDKSRLINRGNHDCDIDQWDEVSGDRKTCSEAEWNVSPNLSPSNTNGLLTLDEQVSCHANYSKLLICPECVIEQKVKNSDQLDSDVCHCQDNGICMGDTSESNIENKIISLNASGSKTEIDKLMCSHVNLLTSSSQNIQSKACEERCICSKQLLGKVNHFDLHESKGDNYNQLDEKGDNSDLADKGDNQHYLSHTSDSALTDSSSVCDWADVSSEALIDGIECDDKSTKRRRRRLHSRSRSQDDEHEVIESVIGKLDIDEDISHFENSLDYSPSGFLSSLSRIRLDSQLSGESTESETLSTGNHDPNPDTDTPDSIPGLNYAMPYLSDRLKSSLAHRIGHGDIVINGHKEQPDKKFQDKKQSCAQDEKEDFVQGRELLSNEVSSGEYMTDERTLSDLLFNMDKIDMIDRIFLREDHSEDLSRIASIEVPFHVSNRNQNGEQADTDGSEADDEFECDCQFCVGSRLNQGGGSLHGDEEQHLDNIVPPGADIIYEQGATGNASQEDGFNLWMADRDDEDSMFTINIEELSPLDLLMNDRRSELEIMFENVILQMLAIHPDLLNDQAPPPAPSTTIDNLSSNPVTILITSQSLSCPICLCLYEETDSITTLPCQHNFHPLCIQAWLNKSGTCPVCRFIL